MTTSISISNDTGIDFTVSNTVLPPLDGKYWTNKTRFIKAVNEPTVAMSFDRNVGIKYDNTWVFSTRLVIDGVSVVMQERVTGNFAFGSDMLQRMIAGDQDTGLLDTDEARSLTFKGISGASYLVKWELTHNRSLFDDIHYTIRMIEPVYEKMRPVMPQIETVVFLMLENRSLDNVLGWLYDGDKPARVYPPESARLFDGLPSQGNKVDTTEFKPAKGTADFADPWRVPRFDPNEPLEHVKYQLYADGYGELPADDFWKTRPTMSGFAFDYKASYDDPTEVMGAYSAEQLPVLNGLAKNFAVSDAWFSSMPSQTDPNRAFSICGTSLGAENNSEINKETFAETNTLFNALGSNGKSWGLYWQSDDFLGTGEPVFSYQPFTPYYFSQMRNAQRGSIKSFKSFYKALDLGIAPNFCYLEPYWGGGKGARGGDLFVGVQGNDYHPPSWVGPAEFDLNELYLKLVNSQQWSKMLFVITFDEHGGNYDHAAPPWTVAPDENVGESGFQFKRLGVRVPTILVSPFIKEKTVFRAPAESSYEFDHTSFISTFLKWAGVKPASANLGKRVAVAPTFENVLSETARTDIPTFTVPEHFRHQGGGTGTVFGKHLHEIPPDTIDWHEMRLALDQTDDAVEFKKLFDQLAARKTGDEEN